MSTKPDWAVGFRTNLQVSNSWLNKVGLIQFFLFFLLLGWIKKRKDIQSKKKQGEKNTSESKKATIYHAFMARALLPVENQFHKWCGVFVMETQPQKNRSSRHEPVHSHKLPSFRSHFHADPSQLSTQLELLPQPTYSLIHQKSEPAYEFWCIRRCTDNRVHTSSVSVILSPLHKHYHVG